MRRDTIQDSGASLGQHSWQLILFVASVIGLLVYVTMLHLYDKAGASGEDHSKHSALIATPSSPAKSATPKGGRGKKNKGALAVYPCLRQTHDLCSQNKKGELKEYQTKLKQK